MFDFGALEAVHGAFGGDVIGEVGHPQSDLVPNRFLPLGLSLSRRRVHDHLLRK
jgi:hypothetical protein